MSQGKCFLVIDPGSYKTGLALLTFDGKVLHQEIADSDALITRCEALYDRWLPSLWIAGDKKAGKKTSEKIIKLFEDRLPYYLVDEHKSTEEARALYWKKYPPKGIYKLVPLSLLKPSIHLDDWAAVVIGQRWLNKKNKETKK